MDCMDEQVCLEGDNVSTEQKKHRICFKVTKEYLSRLGDSAQAFLKKVFTKKALPIIGLAVVVLLGAIIGIGYATNNYMTPVRYAEKQANWKELNAENYISKGFKDLGAKNEKEIVKIFCQSDVFLDWMESMEDEVEKSYEERQDQYGDNFKVKYSVQEKVKLERADLREYRNYFRKLFDSIQEMLDMSDDFDSDDWGDFAEELELSRTHAKKLVALYGDMLEDIGRVEVADGYELNVLRIITGDMLDESIEEEITITVLKVNGRWVGAELSMLEILSNLI